MSTPSVLETLRELERSLHDPGLRSDAGAAGGLLHPRFCEFGRSGTAYTRDQILAAMTGAAQTLAIWSQDFAVDELRRGFALLTYRSALLTPAGQLEDHALRSSLWVLTEEGWRLRFHQGTPTAPFAKSQTETRS